VSAPGRIAIGGAVARKPGAAGHAWQFLQYLLGFRSLGYEVLLLDRLEGGHAAGIEWVRRTLRDAGMDGAYSIDLGDGVHAGVPRADALAFLRGADLLLNVMGYVTDEELLAAAPCRVFLDTDPGFGQMWLALGLADVFAGHDVHVTIGERIGAADCTVPDCGIDWITSPQPVALGAWPKLPAPRGGRATSVASWRWTSIPPTPPTPGRCATAAGRSPIPRSSPLPRTDTGRTCRPPPPRSWWPRACTWTAAAAG